MTTGHVFLATSLDGYLARMDDSLDWLPQEPVEGEDSGFDAFMSTVDGLIMGSQTFKKVLSFGEWPYSKPVIVLSQSLGEEDIPPDLRHGVRISDASPRKVMKDLFKEGWSRAYVDGGSLVQSFLREGLIKDLVITVIPVLIGEGKPLFGPLSKDISLKLISSKSFSSGMLQHHYRILSSGEE